MSKIGNMGELNILARYTTVMAISIASTTGSLPKNTLEHDLTDGQNAIEQRANQREGNSEY
jgi:hypothetical protein